MSRHELMKQVQLLLQQILLMDSRPDEPSWERSPKPNFMGTVAPEELPAIPPIIFFRKSFYNMPGEEDFSYAFIRVDHDGKGRWYGTGSMAKVFTWDGLMHWLEASGPMPDIYVMTEAKLLPRKDINYTLPRIIDTE